MQLLVLEGCNCMPGLYRLKLRDAEALALKPQQAHHSQANPNAMQQIKAWMLDMKGHAAAYRRTCLDLTKEETP